ncbi:chemotaxis-specific protein-glutamate methyltransferase CheB [Mangrovivirga sp. M17]|uniref:Protein-glutamate methylesterase/protein-glutamine glutaminase n=1 Tax=Mangrovivirga halotolerans TaxID=2993936 RepID=A0ABT3RN19_9BACT|nr:chemotaxis-specific protein-glutamate methyltransferase CheB [Mangrovivirga halotolerans]MCX2743204.1 chemotaxis-specific protein-glutamate methyltransferase CheB [Mangrovivirga halotolerans]
MVKAVVVDDSGLMRILISDILRSDGRIKVVGTASNGLDGLNKVLDTNPDVVITDMLMPSHDGLFLVKEVMKKQPTPVILLSSLERTNEKIFDALEAGAFEFIDKPVNGAAFSSDYPLNELVIQATKSKHNLDPKVKTRQNNNLHTFDDKLNYDIVCIGASTGGPGALEILLKRIPANFPLPIVIAQHMPERFIRSFVMRLNKIAPLKISLAKKGEAPVPGNVYLAPGNSNLSLVRSRINGIPVFSSSKRQFEEFNNPSVDCLFTSAAEVYGARCIGVILTGMGKDGYDGSTMIRNKKGLVIAQDQDSSVVYGMPGMVVNNRIAKYTVGISEMASFLTGCL